MSCILASGGLDKDGYGQRHYRGHNVKAHRLAYAEAHGLDVLTMGGIVMHSCDRPACINPAHLIMGTTQDNVDDKISKGRHRQGAELLSAKLTELDVQAIRVAYIPRHPEFNQHALARRYGVSQRTVAKVLHGVSYKGKQ